MATLWLALASLLASPVVAIMITAGDGQDDREIQVPLDDTGIADWRFLSPRQPATLRPDEAPTSSFCDLTIRFSSSTSDRSFIVKFEVAKAVVEELEGDTGGTDQADLTQEALAALQPDPDREEPPRFGNFVVQCKDDTCTYTGTVSPGIDALLPAKALYMPCGARAEPPEACKGDAAKSVKAKKTKTKKTKTKAKARTLEQRVAELEKQLSKAATDKKKLLIPFSVSFFDDADSASNSTGYFYVDALCGEPAAKELESKTRWQLAATVGYNQDPDPLRDMDGKEVPYTVDTPFVGDTRNRFTGSARLELKTNLGSRADGEVKLGIKSGDLGAKDQSGDVKASEYSVNVFGLRNLNLRFGKFTLANPVSSVAMKVQGEGFEIYRKNLSLGYLAARESLDGVANAGDRDRRMIVAEYKVPWGWCWKNVRDDTDPTRTRRETVDCRTVLTLGGVRLTGLELYGLWGEDESDSELTLAGQTVMGPYKHRTLGADLGFRRGKAAASGKKNAWIQEGSIAYFESQRDPAPGATIPEGEGSASLVTVTATRLAIDAKKRKAVARLSLRLQYGEGSGDDPTTANVDEGYVGETASFKPDTLFLNSLAGRISAGVDGMPTGTVAAGLSNKEYLGLTVTVNEISLLEAIARLLEVDNDIYSQKTVLRIHRYRFDEPVLGNRKAGNEVSLEFEMQAPKDVKIKLGGAIFSPDGALETVITDDAWTVFSSVSVKI